MKIQNSTQRRFATKSKSLQLISQKENEILPDNNSDLSQPFPRNQLCKSPDISLWIASRNRSFDKINAPQIEKTLHDTERFGLRF